MAVDGNCERRSTEIALKTSGLVAVRLLMGSMPGAAVAFDQLVGAGRTHAAWRIGIGLAPIRPEIEEGLHGGPAGFDAIGALEKGLVSDEEFVEQALITGLLADIETVGITEIE